MLFSLPVLMYHSVSDAPDGLCVSPAHFEDQCRALQRAGWRSIPLCEAETYALRGRTLPVRTLLMTFDDGFLDNFVYAAPIMREYRHAGAVFPVLREVETEKKVRLTLDDLRSGEVEREAFPVPLGPVVTDDADDASGAERPEKPGRFCSWEELRRLQAEGTLASAPHSTDHGRVLTGPAFSGFLTPKPRHRYFDRLPVSLPWGMPRFKPAPALAARAFFPAPELIDLVRDLVPQNEGEAAAFLGGEKNLAALSAAVVKLPSLGREETESEHRARLAQEFVACRERFAKELGLSPISFCWPWGRHTPEALQEAKRVGFQVFFTTRRGANLPGCAERICRFRVGSVPGADLLRQVRFFALTPAAALYGLLRPYR